jgi:hypothetical protein
MRRFLLDELRKADRPISSRDLAEKIIRLESKDPRDRRLRNHMVKRVGKSLKLLRRQGKASSGPGPNHALVWSVFDEHGDKFAESGLHPQADMPSPVRLVR